jgi:hypothetical protein
MSAQASIDHPFLLWILLLAELEYHASRISKVILVAVHICQRSGKLSHDILDLQWLEGGMFAEANVGPTSRGCGKAVLRGGKAKGARLRIGSAKQELHVGIEPRMTPVESRAK